MKKIFLLLIILVIAFFGFQFYTTPTMITPYPYIIKQTNWPGQKEAQNSQVLIIGDRMGQKLENHLSSITKMTSKNLKEPLRIFNWSHNNHGLHRTIAKIKSLQKIPRIVIYHGNSQELFEKKFSIQDRDKIVENIKKYNNDSTISLILTFPILSKFIYHKVHYYELEEKIGKTNKTYSSRLQQILMELSYKIYELELKELMEYIRSKGSQLVMITTPINLDIPPKSVCDNATSPTLEEELLQIEDTLKSGDIKSALNRLRKVNKVAVANGRAHYLQGQAIKALGNYAQARKLLHQAAVYDCKAWRSNIVYNNIMRSLARKNNLPLIDFDQQVNKHYGQNVLFFDEIFPQEIFYGQIVKILSLSIIKILHI